MGMAPIHREVAKFVRIVWDAEPEEIRMKNDNSFMIKFSTIADALQLLYSKELFKRNHLVQIEPWTPQVDPDRTECAEKFM